MKVDKIVVKIASRCNINCSYCYMYNLGDSSYKMQPKFLGIDTTEKFVEKLLKHLEKNKTKGVFIIIHGGEPLLMPKKEFEAFINAFNTIKDKNIKVYFSLQTNGILVSEEWVEIFKKYKINIGISLDGPKEVNDKFRIDKKGNGTYDDVIKGLNVLRKNGFNSGVLSVMNLESDPIEFYNHFKELNVPSIDVLLLDATYDSKKEIFNKKLNPSDWYIQIFNKWFNDGDQKFRIRIFDILIKAILGQDIQIDILGVHENNVMVLETNGDIEAVDVLKACGESFTKNGINVKTHDIDDVAESDLIDVYYNSGKYLPVKCLACPIQELCGGGYLPHRYSSINGFNNPTIYCNDLLKLITHIQNTIIDSMPAKLIAKTGISKLTYEEAIQIIEENIPKIPQPSYIAKLEQFKKQTTEVEV